MIQDKRETIMGSFPCLQIALPEPGLLMTAVICPVKIDTPEGQWLTLADVDKGGEVVDGRPCGAVPNPVVEPAQSGSRRGRMISGFINPNSW